MVIRQLIIILVCNLFFIIRNSGQNCTPPITPSADCATAPALCLSQLCYTTSDTTNVCCNNWCGNNTIINNPQYFLITPAQPDVSIDIHVDDCSDGTGLQGAILDACPWNNSNVINCDPGTNPGGTIILQASSLLPGQVYWLLIDGSNGAVCHYTISSATGLQFPTLPDSLDATLSFPSDTLVCPGYQNLILNTGPEIPGATYQWTLGWTGERITSTVPSITVNINEGSPEGTWNVCVMALTNCDTAHQVCFPIQIGSTPTAIKDTAIFCNNNFPFQWHGQNITGPGDYSATFTDEHSCSFDSTWTVLTYPDFPHGAIDTFVCSPQFTYGDQVFDSSGNYFAVLPSATVNGCDSLVDVHLTIGASDQFVEVACENNEMVLKVHITAQDENIDTVTFEWYTCSFDSLLSTAADFFPDASGCYSLVISSGFCRDTISSTYNNSGCIVNDLCYFNTSPACAGIPTLITPVFEVPQESRIHWLIDYPGAPGTYAGNTDSIYVNFPEAGSYPVSYTIQDTFGTWSCHAFMQVNTGPEVSLCCDQATCDSCAFITLTNYSDDWASVYLTNGISTSVFGNGTMTLEVCMPIGDSSIIGIAGIESNENGCTGTIAGDTFVTITRLPPALVFIVPFEDTLCTYPNDLASYKWRHCDSTEILSTATCFAPSAYGCYCLEVENEFGCTYETCYNFFPEATSMIEDDQLLISPNPSSGTIQITVSDATDIPILWQLLDAQGKFILEGELAEKVSEVNFNPIPPGIYFLKFNFKSKGILVRKIVIE